MKLATKVLAFLLVALMTTTLIPNIPASANSDSYALSGGTISVTDTGTYTVALQTTDGAWLIANGADVTAWFVNSAGGAVFTNASGVAKANYKSGNTLIEVTLDASKIAGFTSNGSGDIYILPPVSAISLNSGTYTATATKVGSYTIPTLTVNSNLYGSVYTHGKSTLKHFYGYKPEYDPNSKATLTLSMSGLDNSKIKSNFASVKLDDGDGYYANEYTFKPTALSGSWSNGSLNYSLTKGDLEINTSDYLITDTNSGREWSCLGGDGHGNYYYNLTVSGITYNGLPVAPQTFRAHIYVYGYNYTSDAQSLYGNGSVVTATIAPLSSKVSTPPVAVNDPVWTWVGDGDKPVVCDGLADDFYITWPTRVNASALTSSDFSMTMYSKHGDAYTLKKDQDFVVNSTAGETQIALKFQYWPFVPVYSTMKLEVRDTNLQYTGTLSASDLSKTYDIASVYVYEAQQGGGGTTVDGTVTAYSFYGLKNLTNVNQLMSNVTYTLRATVNGSTKYYVENEGIPALVDSTAAAKAFNGNVPSERNLRLIGNTTYVTTRSNQTVDFAVNGTTYTFTKVYSGGGLLNPKTCDQNLIAEDGYIIPWGTSNWITQEKWAWQKSIAVGWTGIAVTPYTGKFTWTMQKGGVQQFTAPADDVTWEIVGKVADGTTLSSTGLLTIAENEMASTFAIRATSAAGGVMKGSVNITVSAASSGNTWIKQSVQTGETITVPVTLKDCVQFAGARGIIEYDKTLLTLESIAPKKGFLMTSSGGTFVVVAPAGTGLDGDVIIGYATFSAKANLIDDVKTTVSLPADKLVAYNAEGQTTTVKSALVEVTIFGEAPLTGDVNLDGTVDLADAIVLMQYLASSKDLSARQLKAADVNKDGKVNVGDVTIIMQMCL